MFSDEMVKHKILIKWNLSLFKLAGFKENNLSMLFFPPTFLLLTKH